jgi:hypothetical protein
MLKRLYVLLFLLLFVLTCTFSQKSFQPKQADAEFKGIIYRKENTGLLTLHTNGFALAYHSGVIKTYYKTNYYNFEFGYISDPREQSQNRNIPVSFNKISKSFKFGKQNQVFLLRAGKGVKRLITDKARRRGVALGYNYEFGPTIAILKPYYLELVYDFETENGVFSELREERYSKSNEAKFLDYNSVFGGGSAYRGFGELSIVPGAQAKLGLFFSLGAFEEYARSLEVGIMTDFFIRKIPIMVETETITNKPYFINFYATLEFGKRSN